jgi:hypothetical protein
MRHTNRNDSYIYITTHTLIYGRNEAREKIIHMHYIMRHSVAEVAAKHAEV